MSAIIGALIRIFIILKAMDFVGPFLSKYQDCLGRVVVPTDLKARTKFYLLVILSCFLIVGLCIWVWRLICRIIDWVKKLFSK